MSLFVIGLRYLQPPKQIIWPNLADSIGGGKVGGDEHIFRVLAWLLPLSAETEVWRKPFVFASNVNSCAGSPHTGSEM